LEIAIHGNLSSLIILIFLAYPVIDETKREDNQRIQENLSG
jgi:hypothetical protein